MELMQDPKYIAGAMPRNYCASETTGAVWLTVVCANLEVFLYLAIALACEVMLPEHVEHLLRSVSTDISPLQHFEQFDERIYGQCRGAQGSLVFRGAKTAPKASAASSSICRRVSGSSDS